MSKPGVVPLIRSEGQSSVEHTQSCFLFVSGEEAEMNA